MHFCLVVISPVVTTLLVPTTKHCIIIIHQMFDGMLLLLSTEKTKGKCCKVVVHTKIFFTIHIHVKQCAIGCWQQLTVLPSKGSNLTNHKIELRKING